MAIIYKLTNKLNNLIYVGCTGNLIKRMQSHKSDMKRKNNALYKAMREYGFDAFEVSVIEEVDDDVKFDQEKYWIAKLDSMNLDVGYNRTIGGTGTIGYVFTEQDLKKKSENLKGKYRMTDEHKAILSKFHKGKYLTEEQKQTLSQSCLGRPSAFKGHHHTEESKRLGTITKKEHGFLKPVVGTNILTNEKLYFDSLADATRFILETRDGKYTTVISHIRNNIVGNYSSKSAYGFKWEYAEKSNDYPDRE